MLYPKYDPDTYVTRDLYRKVTETKDLRYVWAHINSQKWGANYDQFLAICHDGCACCGSKLDYGLGKNNNNKKDDETPSTDHKIPQAVGKKLGWTEKQINDISNLWVICWRCNRIKSDAHGEKDLRRFESLASVLREVMIKSGNLLVDP